ncbi:hypothetical protein K438DRAFT_1816732 [Mycena galopus ATCC 62051]|nr:hypothetical protein K438DRAFT_1816732 [Mycena galopus ATCC 62051]
MSSPNGGLQPFSFIPCDMILKYLSSAFTKSDWVSVDHALEHLRNNPGNEEYKPFLDLYQLFPVGKKEHDREVDYIATCHLPPTRILSADNFITAPLDVDDAEDNAEDEVENPTQKPDRFRIFDPSLLPPGAPLTCLSTIHLVPFSKLNLHDDNSSLLWRIPAFVTSVVNPLLLLFLWFDSHFPSGFGIATQNHYLLFFVSQVYNKVIRLPEQSTLKRRMKCLSLVVLIVMMGCIQDWSPNPNVNHA